MYFLITLNDQIEECHSDGVFSNKLVVNTERNQVQSLSNTDHIMTVKASSHFA